MDNYTQRITHYNVVQDASKSNTLLCIVPKKLVKIFWKILNRTLQNSKKKFDKCFSLLIVTTQSRLYTRIFVLKVLILLFFCSHFFHNIVGDFIYNYHLLSSWLTPIMLSELQDGEQLQLFTRTGTSSCGNASDFSFCHFSHRSSASHCRVFLREFPLFFSSIHLLLLHTSFWPIRVVG